MEYLISIIIPYYCTPLELFDKCMSSILAASLTDVEIIVIDDGSPEKYHSIVDKYIDNSNVRIIRTLNSGVSAARNLGIKEANGKWVLFVDSDDYIDPVALKSIANYANSHESDIILLGGGRDRNGTIDYNTYFLKPDINYAESIDSVLPLMESALAVGIIPRGYVQYFSLGAPYCKLLSAEFLRKNNLSFDPEVKFAEDTLFSLNLYKRANSIYFFDVFLYFYVFNQESVTRKFRPGLSKDMDVFFAKVKSFLESQSIFDKLENAYLLRAEFEVTRVFKLEFFNVLNTDRAAKNKYRSFINRYPYNLAIKRDLLPRGKSFKSRLFRMFVKRGYGNLYRFIKTSKK